MRRAEVFGLRESDIDFEKNLIIVQLALFWMQGKAASIQVTCDIYPHQLRETNPKVAAKTDLLIFGQTQASC